LLSSAGTSGRHTSLEEDSLGTGGTGSRTRPATGRRTPGPSGRLGGLCDGDDDSASAACSRRRRRPRVGDVTADCTGLDWAATYRSRTGASSWQLRTPYTMGDGPTAPATKKIGWSKKERAAARSSFEPHHKKSAFQNTQRPTTRLGAFFFRPTGIIQTFGKIHTLLVVHACCLPVCRFTIHTGCFAGTSETEINYAARSLPIAMANIHEFIPHNERTTSPTIFH
jgi:hypothetical protein